MMNLVILGFGFSSTAVAHEIRPSLASLHVTARSPEKVARLRGDGLDASAFDGSSLSDALAGALRKATHLLVSAPPGEAGDPLLLSAAFQAIPLPHLRSLAYLSTVGVYGDHQGAWVDEASELRPVSQRSRQRVQAEAAWQAFAKTRAIDLGIFRLSGIYGPGRSAIDNLRKGTARRIVKPGQVFNRIHVGDIGGAVAKALAEGAAGIFNLTDDEPCPPQDVVTHAAGLLGVVSPPEIPFDEADLSPMGRSFYGENKRVSNARIKRELGYAFRYPSYREGLAACI